MHMMNLVQSYVHPWHGFKTLYMTRLGTSRWKQFWRHVIASLWFISITVDRNSTWKLVVREVMFNLILGVQRCYIWSCDKIKIPWLCQLGWHLRLVMEQQLSCATLCGCYLMARSLMWVDDSNSVSHNESIVECIESIGPTQFLPSCPSSTWRNFFRRITNFESSQNFQRQ